VTGENATVSIPSIGDNASSEIPADASSSYVERMFVPLPLDENLRCSECLLSGHVLCYINRGIDSYLMENIKTDANMPEHKCCPMNPDALNCPYIEDSDYTCTTDEPLYLSMGLCPYDSDKCGERLRLIKTSESEELKLGNLEEGDECFYGIIADCGRPRILEEDSLNNLALFVSFENEISREMSQAFDLFKPYAAPEG
jgi:hypothetical protein